MNAHDQKVRQFRIRQQQKQDAKQRRFAVRDLPRHASGRVIRRSRRTPQKSRLFGLRSAAAAPVQTPPFVTPRVVPAPAFTATRVQRRSMFQRAGDAIRNVLFTPRHQGHRVQA
jgi:hypothetical protein